MPTVKVAARHITLTRNALHSRQLMQMRTHGYCPLLDQPTATPRWSQPADVPWSLSRGPCHTVATSSLNSTSYTSPQPERPAGQPHYLVRKWLGGTAAHLYVCVGIEPPYLRLRPSSFWYRARTCHIPQGSPHAPIGLQAPSASLDPCLPSLPIFEGARGARFSVQPLQTVVVQGFGSSQCSGSSSERNPASTHQVRHGALPVVWCTRQARCRKVDLHILTPARRAALPASPAACRLPPACQCVQSAQYGCTDHTPRPLSTNCRVGQRRRGLCARRGQHAAVHAQVTQG